MGLKSIVHTIQFNFKTTYLSRYFKIPVGMEVKSPFEPISKMASLKIT